MALAKRKNVEETETPNIALAPEPADQEEAPKRRRGGPRGPRTKPAFQWTPEKQVALKRSMKEIEASGLPVTLGNVLHKLQADPAFAEDVTAETLDGAKVTGFLDRAKATFEEAGKPYPFPELVRSKRTAVALDVLLED